VADCRERVLADLSVVEQVFWHRTFSEQKQVWSTSYSRLAWPANRRPVLFVAEHEGFERSGNRRRSVAP